MCAHHQRRLYEVQRSMSSLPQRSWKGSGEINEPCGMPSRLGWSVDVASLYLQEACRPRRYDGSHLTLFLKRVVLQIDVISLVWLTVSKVAAERRQRAGGSRHEPAHKASRGFPLSHDKRENLLFRM